MTPADAGSSNEGALMSSESLKRALERTEQHVQARRARHRADVAYVRREHPELADWLTTFAAEFGRGEIDYRVTLRRKTNE